MKTQALIELLARDAGVAPRAVAARRLWPAAAMGLLAGALLAWTLFGWVPETYARPAAWLKPGYVLALALASGWLTAGLARPVARLAPPRGLLLAVGVAMAALGAAVLAAAPPGERSLLFFGQTWRHCPWSIVLCALPALAASFWALRGLAPVRPRAAGGAAGLLAGAVGALAYSLACPEISPAFVAFWYTLGIAATGVLGAVVGPRSLRW